MWWWWAGIFLLSAISNGAEYKFTMTVEAMKTECFWQPVTKAHVAMEIDYMVIAGGGDYDIDFTVTNPQGTIVAQDSRLDQNDRRINTSINKGDYKICFDNSFSYQNSKVIFFEILLEDVNGSTDEHDYDHAGQTVAELDVSVEDFRATAVKIKNKLNEAEKYQVLLAAIEMKDRSIMEDNWTRVNLWSTINLVVMVAVSVLYVFLVRSLFDDRSRVGRVIRESKL